MDLEKMKFYALKANRGGFAGKLPELPRVGIPLVWRRRIDFHVPGFGRWGGEVGSGGVAALLAFALRGRVLLERIED